MAWQPPEESFDDTKKSQWSPPEESFDDAKKPEWTPPEESFDDSPTKIEDVDKLKELQSTGQKLTDKQQRILFKADDERTFLDKVSGAAGAFIPAAADIIGQTASGAVELANKAVVQPAAFALSGGYNRLDSEEAKKVFKEREEAIRSLGVGAARDTEETVNAAVRFGMFGSATTDKLLGKSEGERFRAWQDRQTMRQLEAQEAEQNPDRVAALLSQNPLIQGYVEYEAKKMGLSPEEVEKVKQDYIQTMLDQGLTKDQINEKVATLGEFVSPVAIPGGGRLSGAVLKPLSKVTAPVFNKTTDLTARGISKFAGGTEFAANKVLQGTELLQTGARKIGEYAINDSDTWIKGTVNTAIMPVVGVAKPVSATARVIKDITKQVDVGGTAGRIGMVERAGQAVDSSDLTKRLFGAQGKGGVARAKLADWAIRQSNALIQSGVNAAALNVAMGLPDIETAEDLGFVSGTGFGIGSLAGSRAIDRVSGLVDPRKTMAEKITNFVTPDPAAYRRDQDADIKRFMAQASPEIQQNIADLSNIETRKTAIDATIANLEKKRDSQINPDDAAFDQAQIDGFLKQKEALSKATPETQAEATRQTALAFIDAYDLAQSTGGVAGLRGVNIAVLNPANADQFFRNLYGDSLTQAETTINLLTGIPSLTETDSTKLTEARQLLQKFQNDVEGAKSTRGFAIQEDNTDPNSPNFVPPHLRRINQQGATAVINADLIKHLSAQGFNVRHTLQHEVQHAVQQFAEVNKMLAPLRGQLFDQKIKNDDGTTEVYQQGIFSDEDLDRYATRYAKLMSPSDDGASFYAQFGGEVEKMRAYIKDEILAETAAATGEYAGGTRAALDDVGRNVMDWLEVKTKSGRLKQLKEALRRNGVIFDNIGATSSVLNSQMSPETLAMMRQYQRGLKDFDGTMTVQQSRESDEPDIPLTKILGSVALQNKYRHADFFEKEQIIKATAPDGSVTEIVVPAGAKIDPFIDVYRTQGGQLVDADGNVVTLGPEITFGSMPDGTKFETDTRIARKSNGSPMILTNREMKARARKRTEIIQTAIDSAKDDGSGVRLSDTGNGNYRGVMSPAQIEAFMLLPNEVVSPNLKRMTKFFNTLMAKNDGTRVVMEYQAALLNGKYKALSPKIRDEVPIGFQLTKDGNFALTTISVSRLYDKMQAWADKKPSNLQPWNGDTGAFWDSVTKYLDNHAKGEKGETGLHPDAYIAGKMKNKINDLFNAYNAETKQSNPERSTLPRARGKDNLDIVIRSRRLDRINNFEESPSQKLPINYGYLTTNYMPAVNPMAAPMTAEEVQNRFDGSVTATRVRRAMATGEIDALESELRQMDDLLPTESLQLVQAEGEMPRIQIVSMFDPENVASLEPEEIVSDIDAETEAELAILDAQDGTVPPQDIAKVLSSKLDQLYADGGRSPIIPVLETELEKIYQQLESQAEEREVTTEDFGEEPDTTDVDVMNSPMDMIEQAVNLYNSGRVDEEPPQTLAEFVRSAVNSTGNLIISPDVTDEQIVAAADDVMQYRQSLKDRIRSGTEFSNAVVAPAGLQYLPAFHGSPYDFDRFRMDKVGTGRKEQAFGHGLYFSKAKRVGEQYQAGSNSGKLYKVDLDINDSDLLYWDEPFKNQSESVNNAIVKLISERIPKEISDAYLNNPEARGGSFYALISDSFGENAEGTPEQRASKAFLAAGIPGVRYLDRRSLITGQKVYNYVIFDENLIKVLEKNDQPVGPITQFMPAPIEAPSGERGFQSKLQIEIQRNFKGARATPEQLKAVLDNPQNVKAEEVKWSGVMDEIDRLAQENNGKVPVQELLNYLRDEGQVKFDEVTLGENNNIKNVANPNFAQYQLPGGINYREVVLSMLSMPRKTLQPTDAEVKEYYGLLPRKEDLTGDELNRYNELLGKINASNKEVNKKVYYSTHFPNIPNYVAHMRLNERTDSEGNDGLFVEEFQSDRHQAGRKMGYGLLSPAETYDYYQILNEYGGESNRYYTQQQAEDHVSEHGGSIEKRQGIAKKEVQGIPDAPFRTTWPLALFKRALRDAVDGGKTWIGWTVGETQNERFDLSKQVSEIRYWPDEDGRWGLSVIGMNGQTEEFRNDYMTIQQVEEYVGKDVALRMVDGEGEDIGNNSKSLSGDNLKVGGEGMKGFYDQILPKEIGKYVAKMGGKVEKVEIRTGDELVPEIGGSITNVVNSDGQILTYYDQADPVKRRELAQRWIEFNKFKHPDARLEEDTFKGMPIWRVNITPEMANVVSAGQMQFMPAVSDAEYLDLAKDPKANQKQLQRMADEAVEQLTKIAIGDQTTYWHYGIRTEDNGHQVGEVLDGESVHWDDGDPTEEGLGGLSSTAIGANDNSVKDAWKTHRRGGYPGKFSYILGSDDAASNDRGDIGEIVLINPKVLAVFKDAKKPVTYDDEGNVIPLSQRFQTASPDIRFLPAENTAALMVKLPQWQAARQPEILSERVKAAIKSVELAKEAVKSGEYLNELEQEEWEDYYGKEIVFKSSAAERFEKAKAYSIRGRDVSITYHRNIPNSLRVHQIHITKRADRVVADGRVIFERLNPRTDTPFPFSKYEPSNDIAERLNKLAKAEARLFLAMEEEGGRGDRMAAKESAAQWAIRTKAAEFAAILDARDKNAKNQSRSFIAEVWSAFATNDSVFQYGRTDSKKAQDIADAVSAPGKSVTILELGAKIIFIGKEGSITIHDANTDRPYIYAMYANSQGKESGGGSQLYAGALDWIHNNGKKIKSDSGLTDINSIRRTSNFFASAIRHGTTKHLQPHADQGLKWTTSDTLNTAALAVKEMENAFHAIPSVRRWEYDFQNGRFRDDAGNDLTRERFNSALQLGDPEKSGIGLSTLQRAIITNSAIRSFARGEATGSFLESTRRGVAPVSKFVYMPAENTAALSDLPAPEAQQSVEKPLGMVALPQVKNISPEQSKFISEKPLRKFDSLGNKNATQVNADNMKYPVNPIPDSIALPGRWGLVNAKITGMPKTFKEVSEIIDRQVNRLIRLLNANPEFAKESARFYRDMAESATMITDAAFPSAKGKEKFLFDELVLRFLALGSPRTSVAANASKSSGSVAALIDEFEAGYKIGFGEQSHGAKITYNAWKQGGHFDLSLPGVQDKVRSFYLNSLAELIEMAEAQNDVVSVEELMIRAGKSMRILDPNHSAKLTDVEKKEIQRLLDGKATIDMWDMAAKGWAWPGYIIFINRRNSVKQPFQWSQDDFEKIGTLKDKNWKQILSELKITSPDKLRYQQARALKIDENQDWTLETWNERKSQPFSDSTKFSYYTQGTESGLSPGGGGPLYDAQQSIDGLLADRLNELGLATLFGKAKLKARNSQEILWALEKLDNPIEANNDLSLFGSTFEPFLNEVLKLRTGKDVDPKSRAENVLAAMERAYAAMAQQLIPIEVVSGGTSEEAKRIQDAIKNLQDAGDPDAATTLTLHVADGLGNAINDLAIKHGIKATIENVDVGEGGYTENQQVNVAPNIRVTLRGKPEETFLVLETLSRAMDQDGGNVIRKPTMRELNDSRVNKNLILTIPTSGLDQAQRNKMFLDLAALKDANGDSFLTGFTEVDGGISIGNQFYSGDYEKAVSDNKSSIDNILKNYNQSPSDIDFDKAIIQTFSRGQASTKIEPEKIMVKKKEVLRPSFASDLYDYIKNRMTNIPLAGSRPSFAQKTDFEKNWIDKADTLFSRLKSYPIKNKSGIEKAKLEAPDIASNTKITAALAALKSELETALLRDQISEDVANKLKARYGFKEEKQSKEEE